MKRTLHLFAALLLVMFTAGASFAQTVTNEPTVDGTLDMVENLTINQNFLWQAIVKGFDRAALTPKEKVNLEIQLTNPAQRNNFVLNYNSNRAAATEEEATYSLVTFNEAGYAKIGPEGGEDLVAEYQEYFKINFSQAGTYAYKLILRRVEGADVEGTVLASVDESVTVAGTTTGLDDMIGDKRVAVYPTVSEGVVRVDLGTIRNASVVVVDMLGRKVLVLNKVNGKAEINTQKFAKGTYYVKVSAGNDVATSRLIVK
ncbi:T9SS type A sorting domain-containing protein [Pontibacter sp. E15-1]|uniref:T9SS type A sorting domain-containing protein n=1 Tax=Pontibacter sp. E15-1 TaxID=2919918 RepID=UPI001F4F2EAC|nr:T9SS type A sorting domain-containing protein [Pontibacter sp. E15-1]MCJ8167457.1 T9SS type A sorting domain-containing protein [Pontibacter sp. E15-1]